VGPKKGETRGVGQRGPKKKHTSGRWEKEGERYQSELSLGIGSSILEDRNQDNGWGGVGKEGGELW